MALPPLVLAGMHRSGTSMVASWLAAAGIDMGSDWVAPDQHNPRGYYEDVEFLALNRRILDRCCADGQGGHPDWGVTDDGRFDRARLQEFVTEASALIARRARPGPWGFKDPRTTMLLDFWDSIARDAHYLVVYRYPWDVADSIQRLGAPVFLTRSARAWRIWEEYNRRALDFVRAHRGRCWLVSVNGIEADRSRLPRLLGQRIAFDPAMPLPDTMWNASKLPTVAPDAPLAQLAAMAWPSCAKLLRELDAEADIPPAIRLEEAGRRVFAFRAGADRAATPPSLAIIVTVHDDGVFLPESLASIEHTAPPATEVLIVDDGSTDPLTLGLLEQLAAAGWRVHRQANAGLPAARNAGIRSTTASAVLCLDADNRLRPGFLEEALEILDREPEVGIVHGGWREFGARTGEVVPREFDLRALSLGNFIDACAVFRRAVWVSTGGYDESLGALEDWDFWLSAGERGWRFHRLARLTFEYRVRPDSLLRQHLDRDACAGLTERIQIKHAVVHRAALQDRVESVSSALEAQRVALGRAQEHARALEAQLEELKNERREIVSSRSWRATEWLRTTVRAMRDIGSRVATSGGPGRRSPDAKAP